jgi:flagellar hook-associated protein 3 FlgL
MRVSSDMMTGNYLQQLNRSYAKQAALMEQSDGNSLHRPSDDPVNYTKTMTFKNSLVENTQYTDNIKSAASWMTTSDGALTNMANVIKTAVEKTTAAANGTNRTVDLQAASSEVKGLIEQVVTTGNTQVGTRYLFSGQKDTTSPFTISDTTVDRGLTKTLDEKQSAFFTGTTVGNLKQMLSMKDTNDNKYYLDASSGNIYTKDFVDNGYKDAITQGQTIDSTTPAGTASGFTVSSYFNTTGTLITSPAPTAITTTSGTTLSFETISQYVVTYNGDTNKISMPIQNGASTPVRDSVNVTGDDIFGTTDIFGGAAGSSVLNDLYTLQAKMETGDSSWVSSDGITLANNAHDSVLSAQSTIAARAGVYSDLQQTMENQATTITGDITNASAADVASLVVQLKTAETLYNMSLSVGSKILPKSLADYL